MIKIYKTPTCAYCRQTTMYLNVREAEYQVIDVSEVQPQEYLDLAKQYGYSVPLVTDGKTAYTGWNLAKLNEMLRG